MPADSSIYLNNVLVSFEAMGRLFLVAFAAFFFTRRGFLDDKAISGIARLMIDLIVPCALGASMLKGFNQESMSLIWPLLVFPAVAIPLTVVLCLIYFKLWPGGRPSADRAAAALAAIPNSFYIPYPLALALVAPEHHVLIGVLLGAAVLAINPLQWTLGSYLILGTEGARRKDWIDSLKHTVNGPVIGVVGGALLSRIPGIAEAARGDVGSLMPLRMLFSGMEFLGRAMGPMAMVMIGALIARTEFHRVINLRLILPVVAFRFLIVPLAVLFAIGLSPVPISHLVVVALILEAASPSAMNLAVVARRYDGEWEVISAIHVVINLLALLALPIWMSFALSR